MLRWLKYSTPQAIESWQQTLSAESRTKNNGLSCSWTINSGCRPWKRCARLGYMRSTKTCSLDRLSKPGKAAGLSPSTTARRSSTSSNEWKGCHVVLVRKSKDVMADRHTSWGGKSQHQHIASMLFKQEESKPVVYSVSHTHLTIFVNTLN